MEKSKDFSILKVFVIVICILMIAVSVVVNVAFSNGKIPHVLGKYIYIVDKKDNMGDFVNEGAAIIAKDAKNQTIKNGQIVLCYPADDPENLRIREIINADTLKDTYGTKDADHIDKAGAISKSDILAVCSDCTESKELGAFIRFTTAIKGILLLLILPCVILVIFLITKIVSTSDDEDEDFDFYEYDANAADGEQKRSHVKSGNPLFEASQEIQPSEELERKKMSIAENFGQKKVSAESTAQMERERTMQFRSQRSAESSFAARNQGGSSSTAPTADALREEMLRKTAEAERTGQFSIRTASGEEAPAAPIDNTGVLSKAQLAEMSRNDIPRTTPLRSQSAAPAAPRKSSSPDITDILRKTDTTATKKKSVSDMSVDDLLRIIENEKKKL